MSTVAKAAWKVRIGARGCDIRDGGVGRVVSITSTAFIVLIDGRRRRVPPEFLRRPYKREKPKREPDWTEAAAALIAVGIDPEIAKANGLTVRQALAWAKEESDGG